MGAARTTRPRAQRQERAKLVIERLTRAIPNPHLELEYEDAWQLLIATILSARTRDGTVNRVTRELFRRFPTPAALAAAPQADVEAIVRPARFFRNKARTIREVSAALVERFGGKVPRNIDQLVQLPGVARKTANIVLGVACGMSAGMFVDTHVGRVARRLGLTRAEDPRAIESDLCAVTPKSRWTQMALRMQLHGRYVCTARSPRCPSCPLNETCPGREAPARGDWQERAAAERRIVESHGAAEMGDGVRRRSYTAKGKVSGTSPSSHADVRSRGSTPRVSSK